MRILCIAAAITAVADPAHAQTITLQPLAEVRLRTEHVDQAGLATNADAVTTRVRAGIMADRGRWSALVETQGTLAIDGRYNDGLHGPADRPVVTDPENVGLYRAAVRYAAPDWSLTAGRQAITLDDQRFVGDVGFRNNAQTFDAVRAEVAPLRRLKLDLSYAWSVRTIWGVEGSGARPQAIGGDNIFAGISYALPIGTLAGFAYLIDQDEKAVQGYRLSSQSYGIRLSGKRDLSPAAAVAYQFVWARQSDWHRNPNAYSATYWSGDATLTAHGWRLNTGYSVLGADTGRPFTSFQFPLGTNFKYQGWADKFLTTPPDGLRDLYVGAGRGWKKLAGIDSVSLEANWHRFRSDRAGRDYGSEIDLLATAKLGRTSFSARYARYRADSFATDTDKFWLQLDWKL